MDGERRPKSELRLRKMEGRADEWEYDQSDRIQHEHRAQRDGGFFFPSVDHWADGGNGARAADRGPGGDQKSGVERHGEEASEQDTGGDRECNAYARVDERRPSGFEHGGRGHPEAESHDAPLEQGP